jgi:hypothetical protein
MGSVGMINGDGLGWAGLDREQGDSPNRPEAGGCDMGFSEGDGEVGGLAADLVSLFANSLRQ